MKAKFTEVLNDTLSYFLLGDIELLHDYQVKNGLPNDLATEFTTKETGDWVVEAGIMIPLSQVENLSYTIIFLTDDEAPELLKEGNDLQIREDGYILNVANGKIMLFTWWILKDFTAEKVKERIKHQHKFGKPQVELENGWYKLSILAGLTQQESSFKNQDGETMYITGLEPTFEFVLTKSTAKDQCTADIFRSYKIMQ
ncbi:MULTISPECIES: hypothetical protein [Sphingobacterium]|uniref:Uncharacterized protein n=1 Tax=Sphingobacterium ginsenosidimutans TaxID=687845 RepID=A0ABP7ZXV6_9SPHI|nr:hypothetical protein [Sphingobacterium sp. E70]ULT23086.1 hypothetical protein KUH03_28170 [Sphingobacterium sp. E70]